MLYHYCKAAFQENHQHRTTVSPHPSWLACWVAAMVGGRRHWARQAAALLIAAVFFCALDIASALSPSYLDSLRSTPTPLNVT